MPLVTVTKTGNVCIPKDWRDELGIAPNTSVIMEKKGGKIFIEPLSKEDFKESLKRFDEQMKKKGIKFTREEAIKDDLYD